MLKSEINGRDPATFSNYVDWYIKTHDREKTWQASLILVPTLCFSWIILQCRKNRRQGPKLMVFTTFFPCHMSFYVCPHNSKRQQTYSSSIKFPQYCLDAGLTRFITCFQQCLDFPGMMLARVAQNKQTNIQLTYYFDCIIIV